MNAMELFWAAMVTVLAGIGLWGLVFPASLLRASHVASRRVDLNWAEQLDKPRFIDRRIYRYHRVAGLMIWGTSAVALYLLFAVASGRPAHGQPVVDAVTTVALVGALAGFCFGAIIALRPSAIKPLESWGNRWIDSQDEVLNRDLAGRRLERWVRRHTRVFCMLVLVCAALMWLLVFGLDKH